MRNVIVHDYLNLELTRIETVLVNKHYEAIGELIEAGLFFEELASKRYKLRK
jgi:uncharacterized protein YutE (UPF0331/DUF86 family)